MIPTGVRLRRCITPMLIITSASAALSSRSPSLLSLCVLRAIVPSTMSETPHQR